MHNTPVNVIKPTVGSKVRVNGSISVIVAVGPTPGSTPTKVPTKTPMKQAERYLNERMVLNPLYKRVKSSIELNHLY
jgi:hypothetical protein